MLSQGFGSLRVSQNCTMFADSHNTSPLHANQVDRAPDSGKIWYHLYCEVIPEYDLMILPIPVIIIFLLFSVSTNRNKRKQKDFERK